jgi:hypothetical protein
MLQSLSTSIQIKITGGFDKRIHPFCACAEFCTA